MKQIILQKDEKRLIGLMLGVSTRHPEHIRFAQHKLREGSRDSSAKPQNDKNGGQDDRRLEVVLAGENSEVEIVGLVIGKNVDQKSLDVYITHAAVNTKSKVNVRAVLKGRSTFAFRGNVKIEKGAKGADAYLRSDALLFGDAKMGDDTPALEILEKDVKAGHAATVGKVDEQMLFYLMSRGLSRKQAEKMLVEGFVKPIRDVLEQGATSGFTQGRSLRK